MGRYQAECNRTNGRRQNNTPSAERKHEAKPCRECEQMEDAELQEDSIQSIEQDSGLGRPNAPMAAYEPPLKT